MTGVALAVIVAVGAWLRLIALGQKSYWWDEVATIFICRLPAASFLRLVWQFEANMIAYYLLVRGWLHFGDRETWLRLLSVIPGVVARQSGL